MTHHAHEAGAARLVRVWVTRVDAAGRSRLEARWVPAPGHGTTTPGDAAHAHAA